MKLSSSQLSSLKNLLSTPTSPFCELQVKDFFAVYFKNKNVPFFEDTYGNLVVGATNAREYKKKLNLREKSALKIIVAHMDHPGFIAKKWKSERVLAVEWHGGSPIKDLKGAKVWLSSKHTPKEFYYGNLQNPKLAKSGRYLLKAEVKLEANALEALRGWNPQDIFGGFGFRAPVWQQGSFLYTKAADDLIGAFSVAEVAADLYRRPNKDQKNFIGLLTRSEEVGFIGMLEHLDRGYLKNVKRELVFLSLEASRTLENAVIGKGPVVRLGDKSTVFDPQWLQVLYVTAQKVLKKGFQRRIMDGGTCEATPAIAFGFKAVGISVPLGNYHNMNFEGGPDSSKQKLGPAPEYVHLDDVAGQIGLARAFVSVPSVGAHFERLKQNFVKWMRQYKKYA